MNETIHIIAAAIILAAVMMRDFLNRSKTSSEE